MRKLSVTMINMTRNGESSYCKMGVSKATIKTHKQSHRLINNREIIRDDNEGGI